MEINSNGETFYLNLPPNHICELILRKLKPFSIDYFRFGGVCKQWRSILTEDRRRKRQSDANNLVPMMVVPTSHQSDGDVKVIVNRLFSVTENQFVDGVNLRLTYDAATDDIINFCGSSYGWLCYFLNSFEIVMYDPFAVVDNVIRLPPIMHAFDSMPCPYEEKLLFYCWQDYSFMTRHLEIQHAVTKVVLSADPRTCHDYLVVAIYGAYDRLAFFMANSTTYNNNDAATFKFPSWTYFDQGSDHISFTDVAFHEGLLYACTRRDVIVLRVDSIPIIYVCAQIYKPPALFDPSLLYSRSYLSETMSTKQLLLIVKVMRLNPDNSHQTREFLVFKLAKNHVEDGLRWVSVSSLDGDAIFVGSNHTVSVIASDSTPHQQDSLYFTDDYPYAPFQDVHLGPYASLGPHDMGIYNLRDTSKCTRYAFDRGCKQLPQPIWILPMY